MINLIFFFRSSDGRLLIASSSDGYCSIINFEDGQLGEVYEKAPEITVETKKPDTKEDSNESKSSLPLPFIEDANAVDIDISKSKADSESNEVMEVDASKDVEETEDFRLVLEDTIVEDEKPNGKSTPPKTEKPAPTKLAKTQRRVQLITISSPKRTKAE